MPLPQPPPRPNQPLPNGIWATSFLQPAAERPGCSSHILHLHPPRRRLPPAPRRLGGRIPLGLITGKDGPPGNCRWAVVTPDCGTSSLIAPAGQMPTHAPHPLQSLSSIAGLPAEIRMAPRGQASRQLSHPVHLISSIQNMGIGPTSSI